MTDLSPAAQAVLDAFNHEARPEPHHQREAIAAAIRAAADQVVPREPVWGLVMSTGWRLWRQRLDIRADLLSIAAELEG